LTSAATNPSARAINSASAAKRKNSLSLASRRWWIHLRASDTGMSLDSVIDQFPRQINVKGGITCSQRPLEPEDEAAFHRFFLAVPEQERMFIKHRVTDPALIKQWCREIDLGRNFPLLIVANEQIIAVGTLHQQLGGWKRHIGRVSVMVHPEFRGRGLARELVSELVEIARQMGLQKVEAEFIGSQEAAMKVFALLGFSVLARIPEYVKDMQSITHDYVLMGLDLITDEEYAGVGG
jgi:RimJ/RimL family protein N-acetyltransferase